MKAMEKTGREKTEKIQLKMREGRISFLILSQPKSFEHLIFTRIPFMCLLKNSGEPEVFTHQDSVEIVGEQSWINNINGIYPYNIGIEKKSDVEDDYLAMTIEHIRSFKGEDRKVCSKPFSFLKKMKHSSGTCR